MGGARVTMSFYGQHPNNPISRALTDHRLVHREIHCGSADKSGHLIQLLVDGSHRTKTPTLVATIVRQPYSKPGDGFESQGSSPDVTVHVQKIGVWKYGKDLPDSGLAYYESGSRPHVPDVHEAALVLASLKALEKNSPNKVPDSVDPIVVISKALLGNLISKG